MNTIITHYRDGAIVHTETLEPETPPEIPLREYVPERIPDLCPDAHDPETCKDPGCHCWPF